MPKNGLFAGIYPFFEKKGQKIPGFQSKILEKGLKSLKKAFSGPRPQKGPFWAPEGLVLHQPLAAAPRGSREGSPGSRRVEVSDCDGEYVIDLFCLVFSSTWESLTYFT